MPNQASQGALLLHKGATLSATVLRRKEEHTSGQEARAYPEPWYSAHCTESLKEEPPRICRVVQAWSTDENCSGEDTQ